MVFDKGHALLVGVGDYQDATLDALATAADAKSLAGVLQNPLAAGYPESQVTLLTNDQATRAGILAALAELKGRADADDTVLIFLCGHGTPAPNDPSTYYFLPHDSKRAGWFFDPTTLVSSRELVDAIGAIPAQKLLVMFNTCFSGMIAGSLDAAGATTPPPPELVNQVLSAGQGRVVISACKADQRSWYDATSGHTLFVQHLLAALDGSANISNGRGFIGLFELYEYVYDKVHTGIKQLKADVDQQPVITIHEGVGPFPLALYRGGQGATPSSLDAAAGLKAEPTAGAVEKQPAIQAGQNVNQASQGGVVNTGQMGNVQTGAGTQWNIGAVTSGRNTNIGGTINEQQYGGIRTGDNARFDQQSGGTRYGDNTQFHGPVAGERGVAIGGGVSNSPIITGDSNTVRQQWGDTVGGDKITAGDISGTAALGRGAQAIHTTSSGAPLDPQTIQQVKDLLDLLLRGVMAAAGGGALPVDLTMAVANEVNAAKKAADTPNARQGLETQLQKIADMAGAGAAGAPAAPALDQAVQTIAQTAQIEIQVDPARRQQQVAELTDTPYFRDLQQRAAQIRAERASGPAAG